MIAERPVTDETLDDAATQRAAVRIARYMSFAAPALAVVLLVEGLPDSILYPYKPAEYVLWGFVALCITCWIAYRLLAIWQKRNDPIEYARELGMMTLRDPVAQSLLARWHPWFPRFNLAAFVLIALITDRTFLALALALLVLVTLVDARYDRREMHRILNAEKIEGSG